MPTKRRSMLRGRDVLTVGSFAPGDLLRLSSGWSPPWGEADRGRWQTWDELLSDYRAVRDEYLDERPFWSPSGELPFIEWLWLETGGGNLVRLQALEREGDALTAEARTRYPALLVNGVYALYRQRTRGHWQSMTITYAEAVAGSRRSAAST